MILPELVELIMNEIANNRYTLEKVVENINKYYDMINEWVLKLSCKKWLCKKNSHCTAYTTIFLLTIVPCYRNTYNPNKHTKSQYEEEPKEPLGIVTEIAAIIFLVSFTAFLPFISKHWIDLTDIRLHLCGHPLAFFGKQFLDFLPVSIIDIYRHL